MYALRADNPSPEKKVTNPGPEALALLGLSTYPVFAGRGRTDTQGCSGSWKAGWYSWPLWRRPASPHAVKSLLAHASGHLAASGRDRWYRGWGVSTILRSPIRRNRSGWLRHLRAIGSRVVAGMVNSRATLNRDARSVEGQEAVRHRPAGASDPGTDSEHVLLTVLGTNPRSVRYALGDRETEAPLAAVALFELLPEEDRPDRVLALCTPEAKQDSLPLLAGALGDQLAVEAASSSRW